MLITGQLLAFGKQEISLKLDHVASSPVKNTIGALRGLAAIVVPNNK